MRVVFTILQAFLIAGGTFIVSLIAGLTVVTALIIMSSAIGFTVLSNLIFKIRIYDGIMHIDRSQDNTVMQLEFCADPRCFTNKDELFFKVDTEAKLVKGRRSNNELVEAALDEIEEFH